MNILVFSWRDPKHPNAGGAEQVMHEHMKGWIAAGHKVTLLSSKVKGLPEEETMDGVRIIRRGAQYFGVQLAGCFYYLRNKNEFDLVVDQFHGLPFFTPLYVVKPKLAVIQEVAGRVWLKNDLPVPINWIVGIIGYLGEPLLFLFYRKIPFMTGSESAKKDLVKIGIGEENIEIINHGVIVVKPKPFPKKEKNKTAIFLGAISRDKGIEDALEIFSILNRSGDWQFWVAGRASRYYKELLVRESKQLGINNKLKYFGFVDEKTKFSLLARAHIFINPSLLEGWGLVNIEANAMGTPVVAYNSPGLIDSVSDGVSGIVCKKNNPESLANEVIGLLANPEKYKELREGAMAWSKKFDWKNSIVKSLALINRVV